MRWQSISSVFRRSGFALLLVVSVSACGLRAMQDQDIVFDPVVSAGQSELGRNQPIQLRVVDDRARTLIGRRYWGLGDAAKISTRQDLREVIRSSVARALESHAFKPGDAAAPTELTVELRDLEYRGSQEWTFGIRTHAALKAVARRGTDLFVRMYRTENEERLMIVPDDETNARLLNATLSEAISQLVTDSELLKFLSK